MQCPQAVGSELIASRPRVSLPAQLFPPQLAFLLPVFCLSPVFFLLSTCLLSHFVRSSVTRFTPTVSRSALSPRNPPPLLPAFTLTYFANMARRRKEEDEESEEELQALPSDDDEEEEE